MRRRETPRCQVVTSSMGGPLEGRIFEGFPPGTTVDELRWFSRRRPNDSQKRDNLYLDRGSLKDITSEYTYSFRAPALVARSLGDLVSHAYNEKENCNVRRCSSHSEDLLGKASVCRGRYRPRGDLRLEGDMIFQTEKRDQFIEYVLSKRPDLLRRKTQLKLEGELNTLTENKDKFVTFDDCHRPPLAKRDTNLHLEGDFMHLPEYRDVFVEFPRHRPITLKPNPWLKINTQDKMNTHSETLSQYIEHTLAGTKSEILRRPSNLKCEGDLDLTPEYKNSFKTFTTERRSSFKQTPNLKLEGEFHTTPEYKDKYIALPTVKTHSSKHADNLILDDGTPVQSLYIPSPTEPQTVSINLQGALPVSTDNAIVNPKPSPPRRMESPRLFSTDIRSNLEDYKNKITITSKPEHNSKTAESRLSGRPPKSRRSRTNSQTGNTSPRNEQESKNVITQPKYNDILGMDTKNIDNSDTRPSETLKEPENIITANENFETRPEYRKAYVDYLIRERHPRNRSPNEDKIDGKPPLNLKWIKRAENTNQPYQVLSSHKGTTDGNKHFGTNIDNSYLYKPSSRRVSVSSMNSTTRRRLGSPTYRLHVTNVDEPHKGFASRAYKRNSRDYGNKPLSPNRQPKKQEIINDPTTTAPRECTRRQWQKNHFADYEDSHKNSYYRDMIKKDAFVVLDKQPSLDKGINWTSRWYRNYD